VGTGVAREGASVAWVGFGVALVELTMIEWIVIDWCSWHGGTSCITLVGALLWWELVLLPGGSSCRRQSSPYSLHTAAAAAAGCYGEGGSA
jgi:hypothetical protein